MLLFLFLFFVLGDVEVLVQLVIIPLMVNVGRGKTFDEAQEAAAYTSLVYLKLLLVG